MAGLILINPRGHGVGVGVDARAGGEALVALDANATAPRGAETVHERQARPWTVVDVHMMQEPTAAREEAAAQPSLEEQSSMGRAGHSNTIPRGALDDDLAGRSWHAAVPVPETSGPVVDHNHRWQASRLAVAAVLR